MSTRNTAVYFFIFCSDYVSDPLKSGLTFHWIVPSFHKLSNFYFLIGLYLPFFTYIISNSGGIFNWQFVKSDYDFIVKKADFTNDFPKTYLQDVFDVI